jgi:hypothetical protein
MQRRIARFAKDHNLVAHVLPTPMFLCSRTEFSDYLAKSKRPFHRIFHCLLVGAILFKTAG